jgi:hypothetical protein
MSGSYPFNRNRLLLFSCLLLSLFFLPGCYTYRIATEAQAGAEPSKQITAHSLFWGLVQKPKDYIHTPICDSLGVNGLAEITVKTNFAYSLVTVVTLGIWSPAKVQWRCGKPCKKTGTL